jgi:TrmH family RNA methyltransferase
MLSGMERISSRQNPIVKRFRAVLERPSDNMLLEGAHLLEEALTAALPIEIVAMSDTVAASVAAVLGGRAERAGARLVHVTDTVLAALSPVRQPSGVVAIGRRPGTTLDATLEQAPQMVIILSAVQDPGNVGAIIRAADACGATGIVAAEGTADPFGWKSLRGSMGSAFRVPVATRQPVHAAVAAARDRGIRVYAAVPRDGTPLPQCQLAGPCAVLLGGEGGGLAAELVALADDRLTIPMRAPVESLNVATAAALVAYECRRQRTGEDA